MKTWIKAARYCEETFGSHIDWEERFFECPECGEPLYECDWQDHNDWDTCPICEINFTNIE